MIQAYKHYRVSYREELKTSLSKEEIKKVDNVVFKAVEDCISNDGQYYYLDGVKVPYSMLEPLTRNMVVPEILSTMSRIKGLECIQNGHFNWNGELFMCPTSGCVSENCNECWKSAVKRWCKKECFEVNTIYKIKSSMVLFETDETEGREGLLLIISGNVEYIEPCECEVVSDEEFLKMDLSTYIFADGNTCPEKERRPSCDDVANCKKCWELYFNNLQIHKIMEKQSENPKEVESENGNQIEHENICKQLTNTYIKKNADYGDSFGETYKELGIISAVTRISDKVNRLKSLCVKDARIKDESVRDTLLDCANYCIMTIMQLNKEELKIPRLEKEVR